jgi:hypothetical protein
MSYEEEIDALFTKYVTNRRQYGPADNLFIALGCPILKVSTNWSIVEHPQPGPEKEGVIQQALLRMLRVGDWHANKGWSEPFSILAGLTRNDRWRSCLDSVDDTYKFADLLLVAQDVCAGLARTSAPDLVKEEINTVLQHSLVGWLGFAWSAACPSIDDMARAMFGDAWCSFALSGDIPGEERRLVRMERPPFMPGLLAVQTQNVAVTLPELSSVQLG